MWLRQTGTRISAVVGRRSWRLCQPSQLPRLCQRFYSDGRDPAHATDTLVTGKVEKRLQDMTTRRSALVQELNQQANTLPPERLSAISKELNELETVVDTFVELQDARKEYAEAQSAHAEACREAVRDHELEQMLADELDDIRERIRQHERVVISALVPPDPADAGSAILEIRPGTGGDEAALFAGDMFRMYQRYAELKRWKFEVLSATGDLPRTVKASEVVTSISGKSVFGNLKFESGVHRVQRVPETERQGRVHTSTVTIAILPQATEVDVEIRESDLRIDLYRASGKGGQHVNTTDSAVRITHIPTGVVVAMQDERSQHKNKAKALKVLRARVYEQERQKAATERRSARNQQIGSGMRSEKIRTYNFPQNRITDHRYNYTMHGVDSLLGGESFQNMVDALKQQDEISSISALEE
ncbi:peptide chain release factor 1 [Thamnocephalis sphaerospora]|uniref:Peptide chain release factor 1 n=1 Tax=Thamnocephalis sphaerospora TaxID=78915 RepID=A0A4V1IXF8_9FUNG|nr:peptide chain release factor 1 [Thamnocephalis sphaerospora]|eukprot:RKP10909.1 peptide chain release factor 1 [Thamnocephalis sphaerospora]